MIRLFAFILLITCGLSVSAQTPQFPEVDNWSLQPQIAEYNPTTLFQIINGAAVVYLANHFEQMHFAEYIRSSDSAYIDVEVYRHASPDYAFGIYSQERIPLDAYLAIGAQGYADEGILNFVAGVYYVKLRSHATDADAKNAMLSIATQLAANLAPGASLPAELSCFPPVDKITGSEQFISKDVLGHSFLTDAYTARYENKDAQYSLLLLKKSTPEENQQTLTNYLLWAGKTSEAATEATIEINDKYNGKVLLRQQGTRIYGVAGYKNKKRALALLNEMIEHR